MASEGYNLLKTHIFSKFTSFNPAFDLESIAKISLVDKGMKDVFEIAESIASANFEELDDLSDYSEHNPE